MQVPYRVRAMGIFASGFGIFAIGSLLLDAFAEFEAGIVGVMQVGFVLALWLGTLALFIKLVFGRKNSSNTAEQVGRKLATVAVKPMFIPSEESTLLSELQTLSGHKPITCTYLGGSGLPLKENAEVLLVRLSDSLVVTLSGSAEKHTIPFSRLTALEITGPGTETTDAGVSGGGFGLEGFLKGVVVAATINAITRRSTTNTFLRILSNDTEAYFHSSVIEPAQLRILLSSAVVAMESRKGLKSGSEGGSISTELMKLNELHKAGVLDDEEFYIAKKKIIGIN